MAGQAVYQSALAGGTPGAELDLSHLPSGIYIIRMLSAAKAGTTRVILMNTHI